MPYSETVRTGQWIQTYTGRRIDPFALDPGDVVVEDIAHALSLTTRFGGHARCFYSVAQHSLLVSELCGAKCRLWGLMHDAAEAYLGDMPKPLKSRMGFFQKLEEQALTIIAGVFGLTFPLPAEVKKYDVAALEFEARQLMGDVSGWMWFDSEGPKVADEIGRRFLTLTPEQAESEFLMRFEELSRVDRVGT